MARPVRTSARPLVALMLAALFAPGPRAADVPPREALAIVGVHVLTMRGDLALADQTVLVREGRIVALGSASDVPAPDDARVIDGAGRWLLPGLAEMHGHLPGAQASDRSVDDVLWLYLAHGVTTVRGMLGDPRQLALADEIARGERLGPRLFVGSPPLHGGSVSGPEQARALVAQYAAAGYDHLKVHEGLAPATYAAIAEAAGEQGLPFGGHVSDAVGLRAALAAGQATVDHLDNVVAALVPDELAAQHPGGLPPSVGAAGTALVPTMALWEVFLGDTPGAELRARRPEVRWMPPGLVDQWEQGTDASRAASDRAVAARLAALRVEALAGLHGAGVPVLLGTDSPQLFSVPGASLAHEIAVLERAGLTPLEVLLAGTANVGRFYGDPTLGRVAVGARADLLLLDADPRQDARHALQPAGVVVDGRWLPREVLRAGLAVMAERHGG